VGSAVHELEEVLLEVALGLLAPVCVEIDPLLEPLGLLELDASMYLRELEALLQVELEGLNMDHVSLCHTLSLQCFSLSHLEPSKFLFVTP
jgi:hypothetical protein